MAPVIRICLAPVYATVPVALLTRLALVGASALVVEPPRPVWLLLVPLRPLLGLDPSGSCLCHCSDCSLAPTCLARLCHCFCLCWPV